MSLILSNIIQGLEPVQILWEMGSGITGAMCCDCVLQTHSLHTTDTHLTSDLLNPPPPLLPERPEGLATGSKVRGVHPIEFQRKISSLGLGGNSKTLPLRSQKKKKGKRKRKTHKKLSRGGCCHFIDLKQEETKMRRNKRRRKESNNLSCRSPTVK